jgi:S1-C subfamily serine protease
MPNDVIIEVNRKRINSTKDYEATVSKIKSGQDILLLVFRNGSTTYISLSTR